MTDRSDTASGVLQRGDDETRTAREVVRLAVHVVIDELVVERQQVELDSTVDGCVDKSVEDVETQVTVVAWTHERRAHRVGVAVKVWRWHRLQQQHPYMHRPPPCLVYRMAQKVNTTKLSMLIKPKCSAFALLHWNLTKNLLITRQRLTFWATLHIPKDNPSVRKKICRSFSRECTYNVSQMSLI